MVWHRGEVVTYSLALVCFAFGASWFAFHSPSSVPPDEVTHVGRILAFSQGWLPPADGPETWKLGPISRIPPLYYYVMGRIAWLFGSDLLTLRLVNVALGVATVLVGIAWARSWIESALARCLFVVMLANTLMFCFLSGSVSYDNLTNLLAACAVYAWFRYFEAPARGWLLALVGCLALGGLAKVTFLPLAAILVGAFVLREGLVGRRGPIDGLARPTLGFALAAVLVFLAVSANVALYGGNLVRYGALRPSAEQVVGLSAALENRVFARDYAVHGYREGELTLEQAVEIAREIDHPGDRLNALELLRRSAAGNDVETSASGVWSYPFVWGWRMLRSSVGISAHRVVLHPPPVLMGYLAVLVLALVGWIRGWGRGMLAVGHHWCLAIAAGYFAVLIFFVGLPAYFESGAVTEVHGRYGFVVLLPALGWLSGSLLAAVPRRRQLVVAVLVGVYFFGNGLPWFFLRGVPRWFTGV